jgi:hypothetical protein
VKMSGHQVVWPLARTVGRQSVVMVGGAATATGRPPALGSWTAWRALWVGCVRESGGKLGVVATYSRTGYSSALMTVGLGARSADSEGCDAAAAGSKLLARVDAAAYAAVKRQRDVSFMLGVVYCVDCSLSQMRRDGPGVS